MAQKVNKNSMDDENSSLAAHLALIAQLSEHPPEKIFLTTEEAAIFYRCSTKMLEARRYRGLKPKHKTIGAKVRYVYKDLLDALDEKTNTCH